MGYYSLLAASRVGNSGKVMAFEPGTENAALLTYIARYLGDCARKLSQPLARAGL